MKGKKIFITSLFVLICGITVFMIYNHKSTEYSELSASMESSIVLKEGDSLFFYQGGFGIRGEYTSFFNDKGEQAPCPFNFAEKVSRNISITDITDNYLLVDDTRIYALEDGVYHEVYTLDTPAVSIKEFGFYLLVMAKGEEENLELRFLNMEDGIYADFGFEENLYFMDMDVGMDDTDDARPALSILALDLEGSFPSTKVFHYDEYLSLFGATSSIDKVFYRVFRFPHTSVLIGNWELVCYNIDGTLDWEIENISMDGFQGVRNESGLMVYLGQNIQEDSPGETYNGIYISNEGERHNITLPSQLSSIEAYGDKFIALEYGKSILIFNKDGKIEKQYDLDKSVKKIYWDPYHPNKFFILDLDNKLEIYSID